jgi:hypothetical protein
VGAVFLHEARGDLRESLLTEEGKEVDADTALMRLNIDGATFAERDDLILFEEFFGRDGEALAGCKPAAPAVLSLQLKIPVLGKVLCL